MAGSILQIPDSTLTSIETHADDSLTLRLEPAMRIKSEGVPGVDASTLWRQSVNLRITEAEMDGEALAAASAITSGEITVNGLTYEGIIPLPLNAPGYVELALTAESGQCWTIRGERIDVELLGVEKYIRHLDAA